MPKSFEERYLSGEELYGDDFTPSEINAWFADEEHAYADLYGADRSTHSYEYGALNDCHGFSLLQVNRRFRHALGFGSNFGDELMPLVGRIERVSLLDASDRYAVNEFGGRPVSYLMAQPDGRIALDDASVDLITCFGVLHHIPNLTTVLREFSRVLVPEGVLMLREPTTSMGDWRAPRRGLTRRERGIPRGLLEAGAVSAGFSILRASVCYFPPWVRLCQAFGKFPFTSKSATRIDAVLARAFEFNYRYHRVSLASRFAPASLFIVASKR
jgi:SAM-dependent methyltransferase